MSHQIKEALAKKDDLVILRRKQVEALTGLSRSAIYRSIADGTFPSPISLTGGISVGWLKHEVTEWIADRVIASRQKVAK